MGFIIEQQCVHNNTTSGSNSRLKLQTQILILDSHCAGSERYMECTTMFFIGEQHCVQSHTSVNTLSMGTKPGLRLRYLGWLCYGV